MEEFTRQVLKLVQAIPPGKVSSYGRIARMAGQPRGSRQVARILHSSSQKHGLPWHRVVNVQGRISLPFESGELQRRLLLAEGVVFLSPKVVDLSRCLWEGG